MDRLSFRLSCLLRLDAPALLRLGFRTGTGGLPRCLRFSFMCAARVPVAPAVGAVPLCLCLVPLRHRGWCAVSVVCWLDACTPAWLGAPLMARVALLACVGSLAFVVCAFGGFLP